MTVKKWLSLWRGGTLMEMVSKAASTVVVTCGYLTITSGYLITTAGYFQLLLVTTHYF